ncbi:MAG: restriction endonuclease [Deinococcales bacterium]
MSQLSPQLQKQLAKIDSMKGLEFEAFVSELLAHKGYKTTNTKGSGDFGVDVIAQRGRTRYAIQVKRYRSKVSRTAISDAVAGKYHWKCDKAWVFTNNYFTDDAKELADSTDCLLTDRDGLIQMLSESRENHQGTWLMIALLVMIFVIGAYFIRHRDTFGSLWRSFGGGVSGQSSPQTEEDIPLLIPQRP